MPCKSDNSKKGDLYLKFNIKFPEKFKSEYKEGIVDVLRKAGQDTSFKNEGPQCPIPPGFKECFELYLAKTLALPQEV